MEIWHNLTFRSVE